MRICILGSADDIHSIRWANGMSEKGHDVYLMTIHKVSEKEINPNVNILKLKFESKLGYYLNVFQAKYIIKKIQPDIINAHYASGYGTLARLIGFQPTLLSVWGSDIYDFPHKNLFNNKLIKKNLKFAKQIASTSHVMKEEILKYIDPNFSIQVTPFGVDTEHFKPIKRKGNNKLIIGTVKKMNNKYGIKYLIEAFAKVYNNSNIDLELLLVGPGPKINDYKRLTKELNINKNVTFTDRIPHQDVPKYLNKLDIFCAPSILDSESFGVAIIEASSCGVPVIVSRVGGLPEVVEENETGYIVEPKNSDELAEKILDLINNKDKRIKFGENGRKRVKKIYDWNECLDKMERIYLDLVKGN